VEAWYRLMLLRRDGGATWAATESFTYTGA
jgi:hypothetical protein